MCRYFGCSGPPWAHVLDFNLAHVRLFQTPDFCEALKCSQGGGGGGHVRLFQTPDFCEALKCSRGGGGGSLFFLHA